MIENSQVKRREWVKNAAIIFLTVMLLLTFFSNTIMNYSLPEVATQYVQSGSITAKIRGTGNVEANDPYSVIVKESRVISGVAVQQGDIVEKDQVLYYLEDVESEELKTAEEELETLELAYMKGLFGGTVDPEVISKVASGNTGNFATYQASVTDMQNRLNAAKDRVTECQNTLDAINLQSTVSTNDAGISTIPDELAQDEANTDLANAQAAFERSKAKKMAELNKQIEEVKKQIADLEALIANAKDLAGAEDTEGLAALQAKKAETEAALLAAENSIVNMASKDAAFVAGGYPMTIAGVKAWLATVDESKQKDYEAPLQAYEIAASEDKIAGDLLSKATGSMTGYAENQAELEKQKTKLAKLEAKLAEISAITVESSDSVQDARNRLQEAQRNILEITKGNSQTAAAYQNKIADASAALKNAQAVYDILKEEQSKLAADINAELDLAKANKDIADKKAEIARLKEKSMGTAIKAPVAGMVTSLTYVAGETTRPEEAAAVIQVDGKGFTVSFSVTNEQAKKVKVGDVAELQNAWYYDDVQAILTAIKPDPESAGQKKLLVFDVTGSVENGQALNLSVGQRSADYELVVPNSAIREDSSGKFILIVESKSSPLGNRYIATRVDVEVLASDDNNTAVRGGLYGYEYVITTSTKPVEAGKQVRLNENG